MVLLLINVFLLFIFVAILLVIMKRKESAPFQLLFDYYTQLGLLVTFSLVMVNSIVMLDSEMKLPSFVIIALVADAISPFWIPLFFFLITRQIDNPQLRKTLIKTAFTSLGVVLLTYVVIFISI